MAHYLVTVTPRQDRLAELERKLARDAFIDMHPFGHALTMSLKGARDAGKGKAVWEEEDYCRPPLAISAPMPDEYSDGISVEPVSEGECWQRIEGLPRLFPELGGS